MAYGTGNVGLNIVTLVFQLGAHAMYLATGKILNVYLSFISGKVAGLDGEDIADNLSRELGVVAYAVC